jgi:hypothetical protein
MRSLLCIVLLCALTHADTAQQDLSPQVKTLVGDWLKAQNDGNFAAYEKLYAKRFTGVRRSGPRTVKMDRAAWMKDRGRMFQKKMTVSIDGLKVRSAATLARVTFVQTWESGTYKDTGEKQLVVVREDGALKISSEEMLRSQIDHKQNTAQPFAWVVDGGVVLSDSPDDDWGKGATKIDLTGNTRVWRKADTKTLPADLSAWLGRKVRAWNDKGQVVCESKVNGFRVLGRVYEHFGTRQEWNEAGDSTKAADEAWGLAGKVLVGDLDAACKNAMWARPATLPVPEVGVFADADAETRKTAIAAFRKLPAYKLIQKEWLASDEGKTQKGPWEGDKPDVQTTQALIGGKAITLVSVSHGAWEGCVGFTAQLSALWELRAGKLVLRNSPGKGAIKPLMAVDTDGDGNAELLYQGSINEFGSDLGQWRLEDGLFTDGEELRIPYLDCPC